MFLKVSFEHSTSEFNKIKKLNFQLASVLLVVSAVKAGVVHPLAYTSAYPAHYSSLPLLARSAPLIHSHNSLVSPSVYHASAPIVRSAQVYAPAPAFAKTILPAAAPIVAARAVLPAAPVLAKTVAVQDEFDVHPQYKFAYNVNDALTGDNKAQEEIRDGDVVKGYYTFLEADGTTRLVNYYGEIFKFLREYIVKNINLFKKLFFS